MEKTKDKSTRKLSYKYPLVRPLGRVLRKAEIISKAQVRTALKNQEQGQHLRIGEIFVLKGWVKKETVEFFAEQWPKIIGYGADRPLGYYLKLAGLLNDKQIEFILEEQKKLSLRFGAIAILQGWIKPATLDFFLIHLAPSEYNHSAFINQEKPPSSESVLYISEPTINNPSSYHNLHLPETEKKEETDIMELVQALCDSIEDDDSDYLHEILE